MIKLLLYKLFPPCFLLFAATGILYCQQSPAIQWQKCLGGMLDDEGKCVAQTSDGGYIVAGSTLSLDGDVSGFHASSVFIYNRDAWIVKLNSSGIIEWQKCLGGTGDDAANCIILTKDGGYVVAGYTNSTDGDVYGLHGTQYDAWIVKLDSKGTIVWQKCLGGTNTDNANSIVQTSDEGYVITGYTGSKDGDVMGNKGEGSIWIVKLNSLGNIQWQQRYGGTANDFSNSIIQTTEGGYIFAGSTSSSDGEVTGHHKGGVHDLDAWIGKIDSVGGLEWQKCLGGNQDDEAESIIQSSDGGYIFAGYTESTNGDVSGTHEALDTGNADVWVVKLDTYGNVVWKNCLGGTDDDRGYSIAKTSDGGSVIAGKTRSGDGDVVGNHLNTGYDAWLLKLNPSGNLDWQKCLGGNDGDEVYSLVQTIDQGYALTGTTKSPNNGDVSGFHTGADYSLSAYDIWVVKLNAFLSVPNSSSVLGLALSTYPNPASKTATLGFDLPNASLSCVIVIRNVLGQKEQEIRESENAGHSELSLDLRGLPEGTYFVTMTACGLSETTAIQVMR